MYYMAVIVSPYCKAPDVHDKPYTSPVHLHGAKIDPTPKLVSIQKIDDREKTKDSDEKLTLF